MKTELNSELKQRFFAQYIGAEIDMPFDGRGLRPDGKITSWNLPMMAKRGLPILLRPLSSITDAEAIEVAKIFDLDDDQINDTDLVQWIQAFYEESAGYYVDGYTGNQLLAASDFLRIRGVALPFAGHSVAELERDGWIKLLEG